MVRVPSGNPVPDREVAVRRLTAFTPADGVRIEWCAECGESTIWDCWAVSASTKVLVCTSRSSRSIEPEPTDAV